MYNLDIYNFLQKIQNIKCDNKSLPIIKDLIFDLSKSSNDEDLIFNTRIIATPIIGLLGFLAAPTLLAANISLDVNDRLTASKLSEDCGGDPIDKAKIAGDVALNGTIGLVLQGSNISIYPGGEEVPISAAAEASSN